MTSTHGAWRHAEVRFLLLGVVHAIPSQKRSMRPNIEFTALPCGFHRVVNASQRYSGVCRCVPFLRWSLPQGTGVLQSMSLLGHALDRAYRIGTLGTGMLSMKVHILLRLRYFSGLASFRCLHISEIMGGGDFRFAHVVYLSLQKQVDCRTSWSFRVAC